MKLFQLDDNGIRLALHRLGYSECVIAGYSSVLVVVPYPSTTVNYDALWGLLVILRKRKELEFLQKKLEESVFFNKDLLRYTSGEDEDEESEF